MLNGDSAWWHDVTEGGFSGLKSFTSLSTSFEDFYLLSHRYRKKLIQTHAATNPQNNILANTSRQIHTHREMLNGDSA